MGTTWSYLDMTALGRQEEWEDSPEGYPQTPPYRVAAGHALEHRRQRPLLGGEADEHRPVVTRYTRPLTGAYFVPSIESLLAASG
jgi:hypothetical protein